jgi:hypothetical protein
MRFAVKLSKHVFSVVLIAAFLLVSGCANITNKTVKQKLSSPMQIQYRNKVYEGFGTMSFNSGGSFECVEDLVSVIQQTLVNKNYKVKLIYHIHIPYLLSVDDKEHQLMLIENKTGDSLIMVMPTTLSSYTYIFVFDDPESKESTDIYQIMSEWALGGLQPLTNDISSPGSARTLRHFDK